MEKRIRKRIRERIGGVDIDASVDAVVAVNRGTSGTRTVSSTRSTVRIDQRSRSTAGGTAGDQDVTDAPDNEEHP